MLNFIQQGVSAGGVTGPSDEVEGGGMTIGRVMDWTEARLDAIKAREEEEDEEREKERERGRPAATPTSAPTTNLVAKPDTRKATTSGTSASGERTKVTVCFFPLRKHFINNNFFFFSHHLCQPRIHPQPDPSHSLRNAHHLPLLQQQLPYDQPSVPRGLDHTQRKETHLIHQPLRFHHST